jgi:SWI/SNF-related matrix-associated actin-dependent regulator of chromatin subfamily A3
VRREPNNQYDRNAIRVLNVQGAQIGHIPRGPAAKLAPYMDARRLLIEAIVSGEKGHYECPLQLRFYGTDDPVGRENMVAMMRGDGLPMSTVQNVNQRARDEERRQREEAQRAQQLQRQREKEAKKRRKVAAEAAKQAKKNGQEVIDVDALPQQPSGMGEYVGGSTQGQGIAPGPSLADIMGASERFNPRNAEQYVEEFGIQEKDLVSSVGRTTSPIMLTSCRLRCPKPLNQTPSHPNSATSSSKACTGC